MNGKQAKKLRKKANQLYFKMDEKHQKVTTEKKIYNFLKKEYKKK